MDSILKIGPEDTKYRIFLSKLGHTLVSAETLSEVDERLHGRLFDLIILESLEDIDGASLIEYVRGIPATREVPLLFLYKNQEELSAVKDLSADRVEWLELPYRLGTLAGQTATMLRLRKISGKEDAHATLGEVNATLRELNDRFNRQLEEAREIQFSLIPQTIPGHPSYELAVHYEPLERVGGDWYYVRELESGLLSIQIADVTGHGLSAAFIGCMTKLAMEASTVDDAAAHLSHMNQLMAPSLPEGKFVTMFLCTLNPETGAFVFARAGHPPGLLYKKSTAEVSELKGEGFPVGFFEDAHYEAEEVQLEEGDVVVLFTDAIPESQNRDNEMYGYDRLSAGLKERAATMHASEILEFVRSDFQEFCDGRIVKDDVTVLVLQYTKSQ